MKRYLFEQDLSEMETENYDVIIVGSGLAGLYTALNIDPKLSCVILSKMDKKICNSYLAQGGIAAVIDGDDKIKLHYQDTLTAGANLCDVKAVEMLVENGAKEIRRLIKMGVQFDIKTNGHLHTTREGGHSKNRIIHCGGDATGKEVVEKLTSLIESKNNVLIKYEAFLVDIITKENRTCGVVIYDDNGYKFYKSSNVVICSGGVGQIYKYTTNPVSATGDGVAAAIRAGAEVLNMEFIQFHPTTLYNNDKNKNLFLISEAVRGEGGILLNEKGERFMIGKHPMAELAPRDVVARAIYNEINKSSLPYVYLDISFRGEQFLKERFPTIFYECLKHGIDISKQCIPVCTGQHYFMGGIKTDLHSESTINGLYACGEAACTGIHGANRLASNSLLECLVFGRQCAKHINNKQSLKICEDKVLIDKGKMHLANISAFKDDIKNIMNDYCGIVRNEDGLQKGMDRIESIIKELSDVSLTTCEQMEIYNMAIIAREVIKAALLRKVSIGAHFRDDEIKQ